MPLENVGNVLNDVTITQYKGNIQTNDQNNKNEYENILLINEGLFIDEINNEFKILFSIYC